MLLVERAFEDPLSFIPERWYSRPEMITDKRAFAPFGVGTSLQIGHTSLKPAFLTLPDPNSSAN